MDVKPWADSLTFGDLPPYEELEKFGLHVLGEKEEPDDPIPFHRLSA